MVINANVTKSASPVPGDGLYHRELGLPRNACSPFLGEYAVTLSQHAKESRADRYGRIRIESGDFITVEAADIIEVEYLNGQPVKAVVRLAYDDSLDVVIAITPARVVKTLWLNQVSDAHKTLNKNLYKVAA